MELTARYGRVLDVFWDNGTALEIHIRPADTDVPIAAVTMGVVEAYALRNWLTATTGTQFMDAPEVEETYAPVAGTINLPREHPIRLLPGWHRDPRPRDAETGLSTDR